MDHASSAERALFSDLTRLFMSMKDASHAEVEASVEDRFRSFLRAHPERQVATLQITLSWTLPEGADDWAIYRTDYRTLPADSIPERRRAAVGFPADILELPCSHFSRPTVRMPSPACIIPFPGR